MRTEYDIDEHAMPEIEVEHAWAFGLIAATLLVALVFPLVAA